jgi:hypothetical protein
LGGAENPLRGEENPPRNAGAPWLNPPAGGEKPACEPDKPPCDPPRCANAPEESQATITATAARRFIKRFYPDWETLRMSEKHHPGVVSNSPIHLDPLLTTRLKMTPIENQRGC